LERLSQNSSSEDKALLGTIAHACNSNYSGDRDQEDHSSKPDPILKKIFTEKVLVEWLKV
jgi:hypothetical protein